MTAAEEIDETLGQLQDPSIHEDGKSPMVVPTIDLAPLLGNPSSDAEAAERRRLLGKMAQACETWGFFQVVNHGIDAALLQSVIQVTREFFNLSEKEKEEYRKGPTEAGPEDPEGYGAGSNKRYIDPPDYLYYYVWPQSTRKVELWPRQPLTYRDTIERYTDEVRQLAEKLLGLLSETLGLHPSCLHERFVGDSGVAMQTMRSNFYSPSRMNEKEKHLSAHSDAGGITVLLQDEHGLEVKIHDRWVAIERVPGAFVINVGDQVEILSNGRYRSSEHRGMPHPTKERLSLASFYSPNLQAVIGPIEQLTNKSFPALYKSSLWQDYRTSFVKIGLGFGKSQDTVIGMHKLNST